jgi:short-subunit dehydrogenase
MNIVITGASKGLGYAIAAAFAQKGNTLLLNARNVIALEQAAQQLQAIAGATVLTYSADLSIKEQAVAFANWCVSFGKVDVLVNNAGSFEPGSIFNEPDGVLEKMMAVNVYSAYHVSRIIIPIMQQAKTGHIFNICSIASLQAYANGGSYSISKFALLGFSKNLREELKPYNIKVTAVMPGAAYTDSWVGSGVDEQRIMEANDVAKMVHAAANLSARACVEDIVLRPQLGDL